MVYFYTKNANFNAFFKGQVMEHFGVFHGLLVQFGPFGIHMYCIAIWYFCNNFGTLFSRFWLVAPGKLWQPCFIRPRKCRPLAMNRTELNFFKAEFFSEEKQPPRER
jgi:hypothetical protein